MRDICCLLDDGPRKFHIDLLTKAAIEKDIFPVFDQVNDNLGEVI